MAPNGEASSAVVAAVAPFLATFIGNHHLGHGGDGHGHKEMELLATTTGGGGGGGGESIPAEEQQQVVEEAECECCGMSEECTAAYAGAVRRRFSGRWVCGLCAEAVAEEARKKKGGEREAALAAHMGVCRRFNGFGRTHPALFQADAMRHILRKLSAAAAPGSPKPTNTSRRHLTTAEGAIKSTGGMLIS
ncbi:uncharacterized protein [Oryza sativa Japonica Group]|uniref:Uncharacterized protein n=2 Tax=Oryza sativa subsp. japonica TaxID=39947 RepID=A3A4T2_ORYSJ|nr:uncharacterized protein LOC107278559 [Oryza sativa Japonica Group]KAB8086567.1 hypothetical protein EE612_009924 [Oryza sativa]EAZ22321.1 hypothetical protein OsJ_05974 [Oryza sativa Japonica Group]KAF2943887.1 hypothetical protein DAI22_02g098500 [Oryza sativa Japonica Group]BAD26169.1 hypothetical protein [Oryza sativa Japonica Group]BAS77767.1 Os02g0229900 [Oryza sativa Japonica Group]